MALDRPRPVQIATLSVQAINDALARIQARQDQTDRRLGGIVLSGQVSSVPTSGTTEEELLGYTLSPGELRDDLRDVIRVLAWGYVANTANAKTIKLLLGTQLLAYNDLSSSPQAVSWLVESVLVRLSRGALGGFSRVQLGATMQSVVTGVIEVDLMAAQRLRLSALTPTAAGDVTARGLLIERYGSRL